MLNSHQIYEIYNEVQNGDYLIPPNGESIKKPKTGFRPNCVCIEDAFFGDSGKGSVVAKFNEILNENKNLVTLRFNGGANAGHETLMDGKIVVTHQLPMGVTCAGAKAIITRGMLIHPEDLLSEIDSIKEQFNGTLPGKLIIDERVTLSLDTHRAWESVLNSFTTGGKGSTGRGIATGYSSHYLRIPVTLKDLLSDDWEEKFRKHFKLYSSIISGFGHDYNIADIDVTTFNKNLGQKRKVGTEDTFIERLSEIREKISGYSSSEVYDILQDCWNNQSIPITIEGAQGAGLDPYHGVYPDVTSSRPMSRNLNDATYNVIVPEDIFFRIAVLKTTYLSSVGIRKLPTIKDEGNEKWIQEKFDEKGRSTGRLRDIYNISLPIAQYLRRAAGYTHLAATHLDASKLDNKIKIVTHYTNKITGEEKPYFPYQDYLDNLEAHQIEFESWDGDQVKNCHSFEELPIQTKMYLSFLSKTIAPISMVTTGPDINEYIKWNI